MHAEYLSEFEIRSIGELISHELPQQDTPSRVIYDGFCT